MTILKHISTLAIIVILLIISNRFGEYNIKKDFLLFTTIECSSGDIGCFVLDCSIDESVCDSTPYKKISIKATQAPSCLYEHNCEEFLCQSIENCEVILCDSSSTDDGEICAPNNF